MTQEQIAKIIAEHRIGGPKQFHTYSDNDLRLASRILTELEPVLAALRAEAMQEACAQYELKRWKEANAAKPDWEKLWVEQSERAEHAERRLAEFEARLVATQTMAEAWADAATDGKPTIVIKDQEAALRSASIALQFRLAASEARCEELVAAIRDAREFALSYAVRNPQWTKDGVLQDPCGAHAWLGRASELVASGGSTVVCPCQVCGRTAINRCDRPNCPRSASPGQNRRNCKNE